LATIRNKCLKVTKLLIQVDPALLHDAQMLQVIKLRTKDISALTRESAIDILHKSLLC
jgi:hypothetical protein